MNKKLTEDQAFRKAVKYYRRWTLGLIPVTEIIPGMVEKRTLKYLEEEIDKPRVEDIELLKEAYVKTNGTNGDNALGTFIENSVEYWNGNFAETVWRKYFKLLDAKRGQDE